MRRLRQAGWSSSQAPAVRDILSAVGGRHESVWSKRHTRDDLGDESKYHTAMSAAAFKVKGTMSNVSFADPEAVQNSCPLYIDCTLVGLVQFVG